jgi:hypothetical protein
MFSYQKSQFGYILEGLGMVNVGIFNCGHLVYFIAVWYILWSFGFSPFKQKSGNHGSKRICHLITTRKHLFLEKIKRLNRNDINGCSLIRVLASFTTTNHSTYCTVILKTFLLE